MTDIITLCGDNCIYCPRYNAKTVEELNKIAELLYRVGLRDTIVSAEEMKCSGCSSHKICTYKLVDCITENSVTKCNQCNKYPCDKITEMLERTNKYKKICREKCSDDEYNMLKKAFFEKEKNLKKCNLKMYITYDNGEKNEEKEEI